LEGSASPGGWAAVDAAIPVILRALADLESEINAAVDDLAFRGLARPYNVNVGTLAYFIARFFAGGGLPGDHAAAYGASGRRDG
jgi:hypothetical protein